MRVLIVWVLSSITVFAADITGTVLLPNGQPAVGAQVALAVSGYQLELDQAKLVEASGHGEVLVTADRDGHFILPSAEYAEGIVAVSENGYAELEMHEFTNSLKIMLQPWPDFLNRLGQRLVKLCEHGVVLKRSPLHWPGCSHAMTGSLDEF
ncbi:MAG: carboxypeptidase-like regulatory domain-containing protein, partial [Verrucomicrobiota bacterium]